MADYDMDSREAQEAFELGWFRAGRRDAKHGVYLPPTEVEAGPLGLRAYNAGHTARSG